MPILRFASSRTSLRATLLRVSKMRPQAPLRYLIPSLRRRLGSTALSWLLWAHAHEILIWASKGRTHTFNYELINSPDPGAQVSSVWPIHTVPMREKRMGYHPTQKPLKLVRRALLASTREADLVFDPFCGSGTTAVAAKELNRFFVGTELERDFCELASRRIRSVVRGGLLCEISERQSAIRSE
jgi:hypothetical protein